MTIAVATLAVMAPLQISHPWWKGLQAYTYKGAVKQDFLATRLQAVSSAETYSYLEAAIFDSDWQLKKNWQCIRIRPWMKYVHFQERKGSCMRTVTELDLYKAKVKMNGTTGWPWRNPAIWTERNNSEAITVAGCETIWGEPRMRQLSDLHHEQNRWTRSVGVAA